MTREEAKRQLEYLSVCSEIHVTMAVNSRDRQAIEMAIKALEQPTEASCWGCNCPKMEMLEAQAETHDKRTETHGVCLDTISRKAAVDALNNHLDTIPLVNNTDAEMIRRDEIMDCRDIIQQLPSVQPEKCEDCGNFNKTRLLIPQPEITEDDVKEYCRKRCLIVVTSELYYEMTKRWSQQERIVCRECKKYDSHDHRCKVWNHGVTTTDWCSRAERREDGRVY